MPQGLPGCTCGFIPKIPSARDHPAAACWRAHGEACPPAQVVYEMMTCLANARWVAKELYDRAVAALGHVGITDVITLMGFDTSVAWDRYDTRRG